MAFVSSFGQTFFIGLFGGDLQRELGIAEDRWGLYYGAATLVSGALMFRAGAESDRRGVRSVLVVCLGVLIVGAALVASARGALGVLLALFLLRFGGQGLAGHLAMVVAARAPTRRGRCLAIGGLGFVLGQAVLPVSVVSLLGLTDWRTLWWGIAAALAVVVAPILWRLARFSFARAAAVPGERPDERMDRRALLRRAPFLAALSVLLVPPFVATAIFVQQASIIELRGWTQASFATGFLGFAAVQAIANWVSGGLVDRFDARALFRYYLVPLALGLVALVWVPGLVGLWLFFLGLGLSAGTHAVISTALWVELFGLSQLGLVRGVYFGFMVLSTALSPFLFGAGLAAGVPLALLCGSLALYSLVTPWFAAGALGSAVDRRG
ncbi:MAG: MFS transporter [Planctomycetota bacterium]